MAESVINRHKRTDVAVSPPDEIHPLLRGDGALSVAKAFQPEPAELRRMLLSLRKRFGLSQCFAATVFNVTKSAIVKWESGERAPTGAAAKLIFLLFSVCVDEANKVRNVWDVAFWGRFPCRDSIQQAIELNGTYFVPEGVFNSVMGIESAPQPEAVGKS